MQDEQISIDVSLGGLDQAEWKDRLIDIADDRGMYQPLGDRHFATRIDEGRTLLVTFETVEGIRTRTERAIPLGFELVTAQDWSNLCVISDGDTWFRDPKVYGYFDRLVDDGFFEEFDRVLFYGAGPCGYAAAAFSVAAPGSTVLAIQPQATLDPRMTEWDHRFGAMRRTSFTDRYGYAPDMLDAARQAFIVYDPSQDLDAMHATLFAHSNVTRLRMPHMGDGLQTALSRMGILIQVLTLAGSGRLTPTAFYRLFRARRDYAPYLRAMLGRLEAEERPFLSYLLCHNVTSRIRAPRFRRRLTMLTEQAAAGEFTLPKHAG